jgi:hypothetical protein
MTEFVDEQFWNKQYEKLVEFKRKNGHCLVPKKYKEDASLGSWVDRQRQRHRKNTLQLHRKNLLDKLEFVWRVDKFAEWNTQYEKLVEFKRKNGHCIVLHRYEKDVSLGYWVDRQRQRHSKNKLRLDRKVLLDEIGFVWKVGTVAARSFTADVSCRFDGFFTLYSGHFSLTLVVFLLLTYCV